MSILERDGRGFDTYGLSGDRHRGRENEDDADEQSPQTGPDVDDGAEWTHMPGTRLELAKEQLAQNGNAVAPIQGNSTDRENTRNSSVGAKTNQVDGNAEEDGHPHSVEGGSSPGSNLDPHIGEGQHAITGEGEDSATKRLHGSESHELDDNKTRNGEEHTTTLAQAVVEDLSDRLSHRRGENLVGVAHAEAKYNVEQEASDIGEQHGRGNSPGSLEFGIVNLLGDMGSCIVVCHCPADRQESEQPAEANRCPATLRLDFGEDVLGVVLILGQDQQRDRASNQNADMENDIRLGHLLHPVGGKRVDHTGDNGKRGHHADSSVCGNFIVEVAAHRDRCEEHLGGSILRRRNASNLAKEVKPTSNPVPILVQ